MPNTITTLCKLLSSYKNLKNVTPVDFIENVVKYENNAFIQNETDNFLVLMRNENFLKQIAANFMFEYKLRRVNEIHVKVLLFFIITLLDDNNLGDILETNIFYVKDMLYYLLEERNHLYITQIACKIFENDYVLERIIYPLINKTKLLIHLLKTVEDEEAEKRKSKPPTVLDSVCHGLTKRTPIPPANTPQEINRFKAGKVPKSTNFIDQRLSRALDVEHQKNREIAKQLLEVANTVPSRLLQNRRYFQGDSTTVTRGFKANKIPIIKDVEVKGTLATTFREAARIIKEQENEIKKIEEIVKGGQDMEKIIQIEIEQKREKSKKEMDDIEKKHLQGLLTYEEAILAKKKLLEANKQKTLEFKQAKLEMMEKLDIWREEEQEKIKLLVEKTQKMKKDARESEKKIQEEKQTQVRLQQYETKLLLDKAYEEKKRELARKMDLIQEIRTLHDIRCSMNVKEFDPTECPNLGLFCEMSIAELQERLAIAKVTMKKELEEKRQAILKKKEMQQKMVENVKNFIVQTRRHCPKLKTPPISSPKLEQSSDVLELRRQLEEKRSLRMKMT